MTGADTDRARLKRFFASYPGKRGVDIPEHHFDAMYAVANGITQQLWGRGPTPHQMQDMYDHGIREPAEIHAYYNAFPHPNAPSLKVGEYGQYAHALSVFHQHRGARR